MHNKLVILGYPRSGTKLLANAYEQNGYHNFREFFNTFSTELELGSKPYAKRMNIDNQKLVKSFRSNNASVFMDNIKHSKAILQRLVNFQNFNNISPSIVTVWPETFSLVPSMLSCLNDRYFLCTKRKNRYDQFLSRLITYYNFNYDNELPSTPITVDMAVFDEIYIAFLKTELFQNDIINRGIGRAIDFDELITGKADLGVPYQVTSEDQHANLTQYIENLDEVNDRITQLENFIVVSNDKI